MAAPAGKSTATTTSTAAASTPAQAAASQGTSKYALPNYVSPEQASSNFASPYYTSPNYQYTQYAPSTFPVPPPSAITLPPLNPAPKPAPAPAATMSAGIKRKATEGPEAAVDLDEIEVPVGTPMESCNVVRGKISRFIESGEMKVGEFCEALNVSYPSYRRFMSQNGKDKGMDSDTYEKAWVFFKKREMAGLKPPKKAKAKAGASSAQSPATLSAVSNIHLEGMSTRDVTRGLRSLCMTRD